jgi:transcriptional regulator with XRE-family HTH domain
VRERARPRLTQAEVAGRLEEIGYPLPRTALAEIEAGKRGVSLNDALAIAAAVGVAPVYMIVPYESPTRIPEPPTLTRKVGEDEWKVTPTAAEQGIFEPVAELKIGERLTVEPSSARSWIRGNAPLLDATPEERARFYSDVAPPARYRLDQAVSAFLAGRSPKWPTLAEETMQRHAVGRLKAPEAILVVLEERSK